LAEGEAAKVRRARLRRSDCSAKGIHRPLGHLQATGVDAAGRKQYRYHDRWRELRDRQKFDHMVDYARALPKLRCRVLADLHDGDELDERRVQAVRDPPTVAVVRALKRRRSGGGQLLAYREGRRWRLVRSDQISEHLKDLIGDQYSAKDFRTWNATVLAAVSLAVDGRDAVSKRARKRAMDGAVEGVAEVLGNTPAVARGSYIDPRVFDRYQSGWTIGGELDRIGRLRGPDDRRRTRLEHAVLDLLYDDQESPAVQRYTARAA
jgi:DNA topoisomerase-1